MEFKITSTRRRRQLGMTLVELLISTAVGGVIFAGVASLTFYTARSFAALSNYVDLDKYSRNGLDTMTKMVRQADGLIDFSPTELTFSYQGTNTLTYTYSADQRSLTQILGTQKEILLTECDYLNFGVYQRNPVAGTYDQYPATLDTSAAKIIQVTWICSRTILGKKINTESVQSAKIVIRKQ